MTLDIIIPQYSEDERTIARLLLSIARQRGIDFRRIAVTIVNDSSDVEISASFLSKFLALKISKLRTKENVGCGLARQLAFDNTCGDYVMYCDADDEFCSRDALRLIFDSMSTQPDIIRGEFLQESKDGKYYVASPISTMVHAKSFRRQFLLDEGIRFRTDLRTNEDVYYVGLACALAKSTANIAEKIYLWKWNPASITRRNGCAYLIDEYSECIRASLLLLEELKRKNANYAPVKASLIRGCEAIIDYAPAARRNELRQLTDSLFNF